MRQPPDDGRQRSLPAEHAGIVGREATIGTLLAILADGQRIVGLMGPGGVGKTTTALAVAHRAPASWWMAFVDLASARSERQLVNAVAQTTGVDLQPGDAERQRAQLVRALAPRGDGLLVLDNLEQLGRAPEGLLRALGAEPRGPRVLATSRRRLALPAMRWIEITPLSVDDAVRLFVHRARAIGYSGRIETSVARRIARELDALPAALELAATRLSLMTPDELASRLEVDPLGTLRTRAGGMDDVIARSWELLDAPLRNVLAACAVFRDGFSLDAIEAVLGGAAGSANLAALEVLRGSSVLVLEAKDEEGRSSRLGMIQCLRAYVLERLAAKQRTALEARHADHFARRAPRWCDEDSAGIRETIGLERANLEAAFERLRSHRPADAARVALALERYLNVRGTPAGHLALTERASRLHPKVPARLGAELLLARGRAERRAGRLETAYATLQRARELAPRGAPSLSAIEQLMGRVLLILGRGEDARAHYRRARRLAERNDERATLVRTLRDTAELDASIDGAEEALHLAMSDGDVVEVAFAHWVVGRQYRGRGRFSEAISHLDAALVRARSAGECYLEALIVASLGRAHQHAEEIEAARMHYLEALALQRRSGNEAMARWVEIDLASAEHEAGDLEAARARLRSALVACRDAGDRPMELFALAHLALAERAGRPEDARATLTRVAQRAKDLQDPNLRAMGAAACIVNEGLTQSASPLAFDAALEQVLPGSDRDVAVIAFTRIARRLLDRPTDLLVAPAAGWFETARGRVAIGADSPLMRVLLELTRVHGARSIRAVLRSALVQAGWPGERMASAAAKNRLRNAIARLRGAGLGGALLTQSDGYLLRPDLVVRIEHASRPDAPVVRAAAPLGTSPRALARAERPLQPPFNVR